MSRSSVSAVLTTMAAVAVTGCVSVLPEQPRPEAVFQLPEPESERPLSATVVVREPDAPRLFASRSIASEGGDGGLRVVSGIAWADRATRMLQVTMIDSFSSDGGGLAVDDTTGVSGDYELYWRVMDFSLKGNDGYCEISLTLLDGGSRKPVNQTVVSARSTGAGNRPVARAKSLAAAGRDCVGKGADFVAEHAVPKPEDD